MNLDDIKDQIPKPLYEVLKKEGIKELIILSNEWHIPRIKTFYDYCPGLKESYDSLSVNFISTGVFVESGDEVSFEYSSSAYKTGLLITFITILIALRVQTASNCLVK